MLCWTLGITEHHSATDNVFALVKLSLLTGHVGRPGSGLARLRGQNNVQGGGDMGALPDRLTGFQHVTDDARRQRVEELWGVKIPPKGSTSAPGGRAPTPPANSCHPKPRAKPAPRPTIRPTAHPTAIHTIPPAAPTVTPAP